MLEIFQCLEQYFFRFSFSFSSAIRSSDLWFLKIRIFQNETNNLRDNKTVIWSSQHNILRHNFTLMNNFYRQPTICNNNGLLLIPIISARFGRWFRPSSGALDCVYSLQYNAPNMLPATGRQHVYYLYQWCTVEQIWKGLNFCIDCWN